MTLYLHARDAELESPVLGDHVAKKVLERVEYDFNRLKRLNGNQPVIVARAKMIDDRIRDHLATTPDAVSTVGYSDSTRDRASPGSRLTSSPSSTCGVGSTQSATVSPLSPPRSLIPLGGARCQPAGRLSSLARDC